MPSTTPKPCACTTVKRASRTLARAYDQALAPSGLNATQLAVMRAIERNIGQPLVRVADDLSMDRTSLYRALGPLERRGWVELGRGPEKRSRSVSLTELGGRVLVDAGPVWDEMQEAIIDGFGRRAWADLVAELDRLTRCIPERSSIAEAT